MSLFRQLGRQVERFRQITKQTAKDPSITQCQACDAWIARGGDYCIYCGHQPPHEVLDVAPDAPDAVIKAAARKKIKIVHPDQGGTKAQFQRVKQARDQLLDRY